MADICRRYERKFRIEEASLFEIISVLKMHPSSFQTAFDDRRINSIYFDNFSFSALDQNLAGISKRAKIRLRWYGEELLKVNQPTLEIKMKNNFTNRKESLALPSFELNTKFELQDYLMTHGGIKEALYPVCIVRYLRSYYVSQNQRIRATIDRAISYYNFQGNIFFNHRPVLDEGIIVEIKYDAKEDENVNEVFQHIPFRLSKNSKYASSISALYT